MEDTTVLKDNKLKTLKDLIETEWDVELTPEEYFVDYNTLRQEAIKWIKELEKKVKNDEELKKWGTYSIKAYEYMAQQDWIQQFFNIEEEDLK